MDKASQRLLKLVDIIDQGGLVSVYDHEAEAEVCLQEELRTIAAIVSRLEMVAEDGPRPSEQPDMSSWPLHLLLHYTVGLCEGKAKAAELNNKQ